MMFSCQTRVQICPAALAVILQAFELGAEERGLSAKGLIGELILSSEGSLRERLFMQTLVG